MAEPFAEQPSDTTGAESAPLGASFASSRGGQTFGPPVDVGDSEGARTFVPQNDLQLRVDVLSGKSIYWDTGYLIRLREDWDTIESFHFKRYSELCELDEQLRNAIKEGAAGAQMFTMPDLPAKRGWFGRRGSRKQAQVDDRFADEQHAGMQRYLEELLGQVPSISVDRNLQSFFSSEKSRQDMENLNALLLERRSRISLETMTGSWDRKGIQCTWIVDRSGDVVVEGPQRDVPFKLSMTGEGLSRKILRPDGYKLDIEKCSHMHLFWRKDGESDLHWYRQAERDRTTTAESLVV